MFKKKDKNSSTVLCMNIYPKEKGGIKFESMPANSIDLAADRWQKAENGKYYYLNMWSAAENKLVPFYPLPELVTVTSDWVARVMNCPYIKLKRLDTSIMGTLKTYMPLIVLALGLLALIIAGG